MAILDVPGKISRIEVELLSSPLPLPPHLYLAPTLAVLAQSPPMPALMLAPSARLLCAWCQYLPVRRPAAKTRFKKFKVDRQMGGTEIVNIGRGMVRRV